MTSRAGYWGTASTPTPCLARTAIRRSQVNILVSGSCPLDDGSAFPSTTHGRGTDQYPSTPTDPMSASVRSVTP